MNCLIIVASLIRAGAETQAVELANGLVELGHKVHLCSFEKELDQRDRLVKDINFHHILRTSKYDWSLVQKVAELIDREQIQVIHGVLQFATLIGWLAARRSKRKPPIVAAIHTTINRSMKEELQDRLVYRHMLVRSAAIVFVCNNQRDHWLKKYPQLSHLARVVHNGIDMSKFKREEYIDAASAARRRWGIPEAAPVYSCLAAFRPEKGHDLLIKAFASAPEDCYLVLAGEGERRPLIEAHAAAAGLGGRVIFIGNVVDVRPIIAASVATVLASTAVETFSMSMLESMAMGVPVIAPKIGGLPEAIIPGETGMLFDVGDYCELAHCMKALAGDAAKAATLGLAAQVMVSKRFDASGMVLKSEAVLNDVAAD